MGESLGDKDSPWAGLNIRKTEWYVKQTATRYECSSKPCGGQSDRKLSQWDKGNQRQDFSPNEIHGPVSSYGNPSESRDQRGKNEMRKSENPSHLVESSQRALYP
jgi:hypothetical protein